MKILFTTVKLADNLGYPSIVSAIIEMNKKYGDDLYLLKKNVDEKEKRLIDYYRLRSVSYSFNSSIFSFIINLTYALIHGNRENNRYEYRRFKELKDFSSFDAIIDLAGIDFTDKFLSRIPFRTLLHHRLWILAHFLKIPVIKYTCAIGPCTKLETRLSLKIYSKYCDLFYLRDPESLAIYNELRLITRTKYVPDTAFFMPVRADSYEYSYIMCKKKEGRKIVGMAASYQHKRRTKKYCEILSAVIQYLQEKQYIIILIPNELSSNYDNDDRVVCREIFNLLPNNENVSVLDVDGLYPEQLKGVISACNYVITSRYHSLIAALSTCTPVIALSWHHRYRTALGLFELQDMVIEDNAFSVEGIINKFIELQEKEDLVRKRMMNRMGSVLDEVCAAYDYVHNYTKSSKESNA